MLPFIALTTFYCTTPTLEMKPLRALTVQICVQVELLEEGERAGRSHRLNRHLLICYAR